MTSQRQKRGQSPANPTKKVFGIHASVIRQTTWNSFLYKTAISKLRIFFLENFEILFFFGKFLGIILIYVQWISLPNFNLISPKLTWLQPLRCTVVHCQPPYVRMTVFFWSIAFKQQCFRVIKKKNPKTCAASPSRWFKRVTSFDLVTSNGLRSVKWSNTANQWLKHEFYGLTWCHSS